MGVSSRGRALNKRDATRACAHGIRGYTKPEEKKKMPIVDWSKESSKPKPWRAYSEEEVYKEYLDKVLPRIEDIKMMFFNGYSYSDIAKELDVSNSLFWKMKKNQKSQYAPLREAFQFSAAQTQNVETSLYRKATGYYVEVNEVVKVRKEYYNKKGKKCSEETIKVVPVRKWVDADTNAIKFFLLNKDAKNYSPEGSAGKESQQAMIEALGNVFVTVKRKADAEGESDE